MFLSQISQPLKILGISATKLTIAETHINQHINYKASLGLQKIKLTETFEKVFIKVTVKYFNTSHSEQESESKQHS